MTKYKALIQNSLSADGLGLPSVSIFYAGCDRKTYSGNFCKGCQNIEMTNSRADITEYTNMELYRYITQFLFDWKEVSKSDRVSVSFLGGEPLTVYNRESVKYLSEKIKENFNFVDIVLYTWRTLTDIADQKLNEYVKNVDRCIMGAYQKDLSDKEYKLASTNQIIYDFKHNNIILEYKK